MAATGVLEKEYKDGMTEEEGEKLIQKAVQAGMHGDLASGNTLNYVIIRKDGTEFKKGNVPDFCNAEER